MKIKKSQHNIFVSSIIFAGLSLLAFSFLYSVFFMLINSFKTKSEYRLNAFALPKALRFDNYMYMLDQFNIMKNFANTFLIAIISISVMMVLAVFASYAFAKLPFRHRALVYLAIISTMFIPSQVTMIPMYFMFSKMHLVDTYTGVILSYIAGGIPGTVLLLTINFKGIPREIIEAVQIDGAGYFNTVRNVIVPMGMPAIAISLILTFVSQCNDLFTPMILLQDMNKRTVVVALSSIMSKTAGDPSFQLTGMLLAAIPSLLVYLFLQKYLVKGLTVGSIK